MAQLIQPAFNCSIPSSPGDARVSSRGTPEDAQSQSTEHTHPTSTGMSASAAHHRACTHEDVTSDGHVNNHFMPGTMTTRATLGLSPTALNFEPAPLQANVFYESGERINRLRTIHTEKPVSRSLSKKLGMTRYLLASVENGELSVTDVEDALSVCKQDDWCVISRKSANCSNSLARCVPLIALATSAHLSTLMVF